MLKISDKIKKTKEMEQYEEETGKFAIWRGRITEGFKKWQRGEKIYDKDKERISFYVKEETKTKWQKFAESFDYSTISKLIRTAVNNFVDSKSMLAKNRSQYLDIDDLSNLSHNLKEPLTSIKGYLQLVAEEYKNELPENVINILEKVLEESHQLEEKIKTSFDATTSIPTSEYDILLIEDHPQTIQLLTNYFDTKGYKCKGVMTGSEGLDELNINRPNLILLDIILPDISGFDICKSIKANKNTKDIPILYLTAVPGAEVEKKMEKTGAEGYILKPFNLSDLSVVFDYL